MSSAPFLLIVPYFTVAGDVRSSQSVSVYRIDPETGTIAPAGSPITTGKDPVAQLLAPGGRFAYVLNRGSNSVSAYRLSATTGALTRVAGSPFAADYSSFGPHGIALDPTGRFAYVASDAGISAFAINSTTGALKSVPGSPFATHASDGFGTASVAVNPSGNVAYVLNDSQNTISTYAIGATGALKLVGSPLPAGQNSNNAGPSDGVTVNPNGKFAYVTGPCCVFVYAIDASSGALSPGAHLSLGSPGDVILAGFAIDADGKFAYALNGGRIYAYSIDPSSGVLKAVPGRYSTVRAGADANGIMLAGRFAYAFDPGDRSVAPRIFAYRISASSGELMPLTGSPFAAAANEVDPIARWFAAGRCAAFDAAPWSGAHLPPLAKRDLNGVIVDPATESTRGYVYDPTSRAALRYPNTDSGGTFTLRASGPPPPGVPHHDLSKLQTASGIKLGTSAATVVALLGIPMVIKGCGLSRYVYLKATADPTTLQFTISKGRVIEIFEDFGG
jgi:6-phosphogluconolactonase